MNWWMLRRDVHISWLIAVMCIGIVVGVIAAQYLHGFNTVLWFIAGLTLFCVCVWKPKVYLIPFVLIAGGIIGLWRGSISQQELTPYAQVIGHQVSVVGTVSEDVDKGKSGELLLRLSVRQIDGHNLAGNIWVSTSTRYDIKRSDIVTVKGKVTEGFGSLRRPAQN